MYVFILVLFILLIEQTKTCPLTDEYLSRCHCGILTNGESYIKCDEYTLNEFPSFKRSFPYDELILSKNSITKLTSTSLDNIKTIKRINLQENSLSSIDENFLRLVGNYLEELILTGDNKISSLEFLTRYPLKKLRILKLDRFNLTNIDLKNIFSNMTKLEILDLRSCQLKQMPIISQVKMLNLENNLLINTLFISTTYYQINLANNSISTIILQNNPNLIELNLTNNHVNEYYSLKTNIKRLDLSFNRLSFIDGTMFNENLIYLNLSFNQFKKIHFRSYPKSLLYLDLNSNQLKMIEKDSLFENLVYLNLNHNPIDCNCHLKWLNNIIEKFNQTKWICSSYDFQCEKLILMPKLVHFNITFFKYFSTNALKIQWTIIDNYQTISYLQINIEYPYKLSEKLFSNQTEAYIFNNILFNQRYHICLIIIHKYTRDKYCRDIITTNTTTNHLLFTLNKNSIIFNNQTELITATTGIISNHIPDQYTHLLLIGSFIGGLLTLILLITCCLLCYKIHKYKRTHRHEPVYERCSQNYSYPSYNQHRTCQNNPIIYNSENLSNSTDSSHMETSLSTTKHIYQTIDNHDYCRFQQQCLFNIWNQPIKQKR